jgi:hypothetical protein
MRTSIHLAWWRLTLMSNAKMMIGPGHAPAESTPVAFVAIASEGQKAKHLKITSEIWNCAEEHAEQSKSA